MHPPAMALIVVVCSCLGEEKLDSAEFKATSAIGETFKANGLKIGKISWEGNTKHTDQELNDILGVKPGDPADTTRIYDALYGGVKGNGKDVAGLYMDNGYLFFRVEPQTRVNEGLVDITFKVYEGTIAKIGKVTFSGIKKINAIELIEKVETKPGELFSRIKLINSQRILAEMGKFDPKNVNIQPTPSFGADEAKVDIEFIVKEI